jgi:hypothetical protein
MDGATTPQAKINERCQRSVTPGSKEAAQHVEN